jgi:hypothetical protein
LLKYVIAKVLAVRVYSSLPMVNRMDDLKTGTPKT